MPKCLIIDTYYPDYLKRYSLEGACGYEEELVNILSELFGTSHFYSSNLEKLGWEVKDIIANHPIQKLWAKENGLENLGGQGLVLAQIEKERPDVLFFQDISYFPASTLTILKEKYLIAGQCSCPMPAEENIRNFDILFTSFPHYVEIFEKLGVRAIFSPLAFEHTVLEHLPLVNRSKDITFVGGVGVPSHWKYGMEILERVANVFGPQVSFYGYGYDLLPASSLVRRYWNGEAWGLKMYDIFSMSKIVINRHGEVARNYANNMRMFEATGCGAVLATEEKMNLSDYFDPGIECLAYRDPSDLVAKIESLLQNPKTLEDMGKRGQSKTLSFHTYEKKMSLISVRLMEALNEFR